MSAQLHNLKGQDKQTIISTLKTVISNMENVHLEKSRLGIQTITRCLVCGDVNSYSDCADLKTCQASVRWFAARHENCGKKLTKMPKTDETTETAFRQTYQNLVALADTPEAGEKFHKALNKAMDDIERNPSIVFADGVLMMSSRFSRKDYLVTTGGCSTNCKAAQAGMYCYHRAIQAILSRRAEMEEQAAQISDGETTEPCGCVFNWNDKFYSFLCRAHDDEQRMHDWAEAEREEYYERMAA